MQCYVKQAIGYGFEYRNSFSFKSISRYRRRKYKGKKRRKTRRHRGGSLTVAALTQKLIDGGVPESKINNSDYVLGVIENNKKVSKQHRKEIREYGINQFGLENILAYEYIPKLESLL